MKKFLLSLFALCALSASAQNEIVVGDMNDDGDLTIGDVTALTDAVLHPEKVRTISTKCDPNVSEPAAIAGEWRTVGGTTLTLTADGDASYSIDAAVKNFEYYPYGRILVLLSEGGYAVKYIPVARLSADYLILGQPDGSCEAYYPGDHFANGFVMSATSLSLKTGETQQLSVIATPEGSISPVFEWTSSNPAVATVDQNGLVAAVKGGTATITATAQDSSGVSVECSVDVVQLVESITLSAETLRLDVDESAKLTATVLPADASNRTFTWTSSNDDVAEVTRNGVVYANGYGTCTITATANDGSGVKGECVLVVLAPDSYIVNGVTFKMKHVEAGTFEMGSTTSLYGNASPVHTVTLSQDYYIGETEVTQGLWEAVMGNSPTEDGEHWNSDYGLGDNYPAYYISWDDVQDFISNLNRLTGESFRMPTEAEWEFAAIGGNNSRGYSFSGSNTLAEVAWYDGNSGGKNHIVGTKLPNELGIFDMSGNVYEWCADWLGNYSSGEATDPVGPTTGTHRVIRGGSWRLSPSFCTNTLRDYDVPSGRHYGLGFRLALSISTPNQGNTGESTDNQGEDEISHEYVDLGLPSGTLWATCNVGADNPEDYGDYFAWGEVEPKSIYNWNTYFDSVNGSSSNFKKYYNNGGKTELDLEDDAAYMNWGDGWRMPSDAQLTELRTKCTWTWDSTKQGYTVVGPNKSSLFLPAASYYNDSSLDDDCSWGIYWSRSLNTSDRAYVMYFLSENVSRTYYSRHYGFSVRPVRVSADVTSSPISVTSITLDSSFLTLEAGDTHTLSTVVAPEDATDKSVTWTSGDSNVASVSDEGVVTAVNAGTATITATANDGSGVKGECVVEVTMVHNGHEYVDLGLPSGTLWATTNVGAENPEAYGYYFAWGETEPKSDYYWSTYFDEDGDNYKKYYKNGGKINLDLEDDAAYVNWGDGWCIPSDSQWTEILENATWTWVTRNDGGGYKVVGPNGNYFYLPAAGYYIHEYSERVGIHGSYWSHSLSSASNYNHHAGGFYINEDQVYSGHDYRAYGLSVRPVRQN